ncbi:hypothetical protein QN277_019701 [Acacia crassicarpa]|uniref:Uncharacterized protein n=1 Tax=Acacia crassicarpa TaxID=499986 RepID=A0AAE1MKA6_9FABA|nr:hypothetical protein QN277_019701 [Acacia crassicarpa]
MAVDLVNLPRKMEEQMAIQEAASAGIQSLEHLIRLLNSSQSQNQNPHHLDSLSLPMVGELRGSALIFHRLVLFSLSFTLSLSLHLFHSSMVVGFQDATFASSKHQSRKRQELLRFKVQIRFHFVPFFWCIDLPLLLSCFIVKSHFPES